MLLSTTYYSFLVSRIPNNHCALCGHEDPKDFLLINRPAGHFNYNYTRCPSCDRCCAQFFLPDGDDFVPSLVPDNHVTRPELDYDSMIERGHPKIQRPGYDPEYWDKYAWYSKAKTVVVKTEKKPEIKEPDLSTVKVFKRKISL